MLNMAKYCLVVWYASVYKVRRSRIYRTTIICNDLIYRLLERVRKLKACGQIGIHICRVIETETQFYKLRIDGYLVDYNNVISPAPVAPRLTCTWYLTPVLFIRLLLSSCKLQFVVV